MFVKKMYFSSNNRFMKRLISTVLVFVLTFALAGCAVVEKGLSINVVVRDILEQNDIVKSKITSLADSNDNKYVEEYGGCAPEEFLDMVASDCKFYINKKEANAYGKRHNISYGDSVKEIKRYLLIGASTRETNFDNNNYYTEFCSMKGYDSTDNSDTHAKYDYLKTSTIYDYGHIAVNSVGYYVSFDNKKSYSVSVYKTHDINSIDSYSKGDYSLGQEAQEEFTSAVNYIIFGETGYDTTNHLYQTVLIFKDGDEIFAEIMVDEINGWIKWKRKDEDIVRAKLAETRIKSLLEQLK